MLTAVALVVLLLVVVWIQRPRRPPGFPPGPPTFLVFGNLGSQVQSLRGKYRTALEEYQKKYGDICGLVLPAGNHVVHMFNFKDIKEAAGMNEFTGRPTVFEILVRTFNQKLGLLASDGHAWTEHRRFALRHLKDLGFGKNSMEQFVLDEFEELAVAMVKDIDSPMKVNFKFNIPVLNILWRIVAGERFDSTDPNALEYVDILNDNLRTAGPQRPLYFAPWLRHIFPEWSGYKALIRQRDTTTQMFHKLVEKHRQTLDRNNPRDFIDRFLIEMDSADAEQRRFTEKNLSVIGMDLFVAGMETTSTTLTWALLFMVMHPDVQTKVQQEIDSVLGGRQPGYGDRLQLPYTEATLLEIQRRGNVIPQALPHCALQDVTFRGYKIPKGAIVFFHLHCVHMDPEYWGDPEAFRPERFIQEDGKVRYDERVIPFGIGKRVCLGETLARMELFVLFVCLMQKFTFLPAPGQKLSTDSVFRVVSWPDEFFVTFKVRN